MIASLHGPLAALLLGLAAPAFAQGNAALWPVCANEGGQRAVPDRIAACAAILDSGVESSENLALAHSNRGWAYLDGSQLDLAVVDFERAMRLNPRLAWPWNNRGVVHLRRGDQLRAMADFDEAIRLDPRQALFWSNRGNVWRMRWNLSRAIADFDEAIRLDPNYANAWNNRCWARAAFQNVALEQARADCETAVRLAPDDFAAHDSRGLVALRQGRFEDAWNAYDASIRGRPDHAHPLYGRGIAALRLGRTAEGRADIARAAGLDPGIALTYAWYGVTAHWAR